MEVSKRTLGLGTENAFVVLAEVNALLREGKNIVSFCIGQPDFDTPQNIKDAAIKAINEGKTGYTDSAGVYQAREYLSHLHSIAHAEPAPRAYRLLRPSFSIWEDLCLVWA